MKNIMHALFVALALPLVSGAQCNTTTTTKILVIGDSWANLSWAADAYNKNLGNYGLTDIEAFSNGTLSVNGAVASDYFDDPVRVQALEDYINGNPDLEYVHFSLGGNDVMGAWNTSMTQQEVDGIFDQLFLDIKAGVDIILASNPNLKILMSGYDYPNFGETVGTLSPPLQSFHPYFGLWDGMGQPTSVQINTLLSDATQRFIDSSWTWANVDFVNNLGLMQWVYGQNTALTVDPFGTYPANSVPLPGGNIDYPSPVDAMFLGGQDAFHLNDEGYEHFIGRHFSEYYWWSLRKPHQTIYASDTTKNGWVSPSSLNSDWLMLGNNNGDQHAVVLNFDTSPMDDTYALDKASIFIQRDSLNGANLIAEDLSLEIKSGNFGSSIDLQVDDFAGGYDDSTLACTYGTLTKAGTWMRIDIPSSMLSSINPNGTTQFRLTYNITDATRFVTFNNLSDAVFMDLHYTTNPFASLKEDKSISDIVLFPNPVDDVLHIQSSSSFDQASILSITGELIRRINQPQNLINTDDLPEGMYILQLQSGEQITSEKFIKN